VRLIPAVSTEEREALGVEAEILTGPEQVFHAFNRRSQQKGISSFRSFAQVVNYGVLIGSFLPHSFLKSLLYLEASDILSINWPILADKTYQYHGQVVLIICDRYNSG
jgi:hypothetical protein